MIYKFKSKATADLIMTGPVGDRILRILGREPAPQGIFECAALPGAVAVIEQAVVLDEAQREQAEREAAAEGRALPPREGVTLRQRAWPMREMMKRVHAAGEDIVWGV